MHLRHITSSVRLLVSAVAVLDAVAVADAGAVPDAVAVPRLPPQLWYPVVLELIRPYRDVGAQLVQ
jgi:hypothetical protein